MRATRKTGTIRSLGFTGTLLVTTALGTSALAQIEQVVVTAQKRTENIQTVPIAVTAYTAQDLAAHQIQGNKDLQFSTPNVTYSQGNFAGANFQIRGIGITAIGHDAESGVAFTFDNVYLAVPPTDGAEFYDLCDLEVLRGPQSTLYGRGATGGVVSDASCRPDLEKAQAHVDVTYGNYDYTEVKGFANVPLETDELAVRIAGDWLKHSGFVTNIADNTQIDGRDQYSVRGSTRWQPTDRTTIDFVAMFSKEDDNRMRADKELCATDPTGLLGCLPTGLAASPVNLNATFLNMPISKQAIVNSPVGQGLNPITAAQLGLFDITVPFVAPADFNPSNYRQVNQQFEPQVKQEENFMAAEWKQNIVPWLDGDFVGGYDRENFNSLQSYVGTPGLPFSPSALGSYTTDPTCLSRITGAPAEFTFGCLMTVLGTLVGNPNYGTYFAPFFTKVPGALPTSAFNMLGISGGGIEGYQSYENAYDESTYSSNQYSGELRFNTKFEGPINAMLGLYYLHVDGNSSYYVGSNTLDYGGILLGGLAGLVGNKKNFGKHFGKDGANDLCLFVGCLVGPTYYDNDGNLNTLTSKAAYGEVYYDAIPDTLKVTLGARFTDDVKQQQVRISVFDGLIPIGTNNYNLAIQTLAQQGQHNFDPTNTTCFKAGGPCPAFQDQRAHYDRWTGRAVVDWTPKLDFTDQTLVYASYSRGYKAGGFNPGVQVQAGLNVPDSYLPESIDAYEIGTKNQLLGNSLQTNGDFWYYNYKDLQVSQIVNNTSVNNNVNARLWGLEGEFLWLPIEQLQLNLNLAHTESNIQGTQLVDVRRPTGNDPNAILIKDDTLSTTVANNCVLYYAGAPKGTLPTTGPFPFTPFNGNIGALSGAGIPYAAFGNCDTSINYKGFSWSDPAYNGTSIGVPISLNGNELLETPQFTVSIGAQYTWALPGDYTLVPRIDYYWQTHMWGRVFEDRADYISSWDVMNAQVTLNTPDDRWYVTAFIKNVFNKNNVTGEYLSSATSGLFTNVFLGDPRLYGVTVGVTLD